VHNTDTGNKNLHFISVIRNIILILQTN